MNSDIINKIETIKIDLESLFSEFIKVSVSHVVRENLDIVMLEILIKEWVDRDHYGYVLEISKPSSVNDLVGRCYMIELMQGDGAILEEHIWTIREEESQLNEKNLMIQIDYFHEIVKGLLKK